MNVLTVIFLILLSIVVIVFSPLVTIWVLNTLFPVLAIPYTLKTWFATIWIVALFRANGLYKKND
jgi:hypothetical protein